MTNTLDVNKIYRLSLLSDLAYNKKLSKELFSDTNTYKVAVRAHLAPDDPSLSAARRSDIAQRRLEAVTDNYILIADNHGKSAPVGLLAFRDNQGNIVVAADGTQFNGAESGETIHDMLSDASMVLTGTAEAQVTAAKLFIQKLKADNPGAVITATGHSLGSFLVTYIKKNHPGLIDEVVGFADPGQGGFLSKMQGIFSSNPNGDWVALPGDENIHSVGFYSDIAKLGGHRVGNQYILSGQSSSTNPDSGSSELHDIETGDIIRGHNLKNITLELEDFIRDSQKWAQTFGPDAKILLHTGIMKRVAIVTFGGNEHIVSDSALTIDGRPTITTDQFKSIVQQHIPEIWDAAASELVGRLRFDLNNLNFAPGQFHSSLWTTLVQREQDLMGHVLSEKTIYTGAISKDVATLSDGSMVSLTTMNRSYPDGVTISIDFQEQLDSDGNGTGSGSIYLRRQDDPRVASIEITDGVVTGTGLTETISIAGLTMVRTDKFDTAGNYTDSLEVVSPTEAAGFGLTDADFSKKVEDALVSSEVSQVSSHGDGVDAFGVPVDPNSDAPANLTSAQASIIGGQIGHQLAQALFEDGSNLQIAGDLFLSTTLSQTFKGLQSAGTDLTVTDLSSSVAQGTLEAGVGLLGNLAGSAIGADLAESLGVNEGYGSLGYGDSAFYQKGQSKLIWALFEGRLSPSGLYETKESELGFRMISSCAIVCHAYRNIIHGFRYRSKAA